MNVNINCGKNITGPKIRDIGKVFCSWGSPSMNTGVQLTVDIQIILTWKKYILVMYRSDYELMGQLLMWTAQIIGVSFLYYGTKFDSTDWFNFLKYFKNNFYLSLFIYFYLSLIGKNTNISWWDNFRKYVTLEWTPQLFKLTSFTVLGYVSTVYGIRHA